MWHELFNGICVSVQRPGRWQAPCCSSFLFLLMSPPVKLWPRRAHGAERSLAAKWLGFVISGSQNSTFIKQFDNIFLRSFGIYQKSIVSCGPLCVLENLRQIRQGLPRTHHGPQLQHKCKHGVFLLKKVFYVYQASIRSLTMQRRDNLGFRKPKSKP